MFRINLTILDVLLKGLYLHAFSDGIDQVLKPYRDAIVDMEERYMKTPKYSLSFVYQTINQFQPLLLFLLRFINGVKVQKLHGCSLLQYLQQHSLHGNSTIMEAVRMYEAKLLTKPK